MERHFVYELGLLPASPPFCFARILLCSSFAGINRMVLGRRFFKAVHESSQAKKTLALRLRLNYEKNGKIAVIILGGIRWI